MGKKYREHSRPTLFFVLQGTSLLVEAGKSVGKSVVEIEASNLTRLTEKDFKRNIIYYVDCDKHTLQEKVKEWEGMGKSLRLGVNVPSCDEFLLESILKTRVSVILAADRKSGEWMDHFYRAQHNVTYIDPAFHPHLVQQYRKIHHHQRVEMEQKLEIDYEKVKSILSNAEVRIFEKILEGKSNREIAEECFLAVATVNNHVSHLTKKMGANDRTHTIKRAIKEGWVTIT